MKTLQKYNRCMDAISANLKELAELYPSGGVVAELNEKTSQVMIYPFEHMKDAEKYWEQKIKDRGASPMLPINSKVALML